MRRFKSILGRIVCLHVIAICITSVFMLAALYWMLKSETNELHKAVMGDQADTIARYLSVDTENKWSLNLPSSLRDLYSEAYGRYAYSVLDREGRILFSSLANGVAVFSADDRKDSARFLETRYRDAAISGVSAPETVDGHQVWVQVAENLAHRDVIIDDIVANFFKRVGWITVPILAILLLTDILIFRRALYPLTQASAQAENIGPSRTDLRLPTERMPAEVLPLVRAINEALDRLERGFQVQREFTGDAAHELRTPLAILRSRIESLGDPAILPAIRTDLDGMARIISQLLEVAELEHFSVGPAETADLVALCRSVAESLAPLAISKGKTIELNAPSAPIWINGNAEALSRAVRNLVENAIRYTRPNTAVEITVGPTPIVRVADDGPGITEAERELIFRRFWRRDRQHSGHAGLGLSIVQRIVETHGGRTIVRNRPAGGAEFCLEFLEESEVLTMKTAAPASGSEKR